MGDSTTPSQPPSRTDSPALSSRAGTPKINNSKPKKEIRILMLHGKPLTPRALPVLTCTF